MQQVYINEIRPSSSSAKDLFMYCIKKAIDKELLEESFMHNQWAGKLFGYETNSTLRIEYMSKVKREYSTYFTHTNKYAFEVEKIKRDFPHLFGIKGDDELGEECTCEDIVQEAIKAIGKEIIEQKNPNNIESFIGNDLKLLRKQGKSYIYDVKLVLSEGQEPHFHDGIPFTLKVYRKSFLCEAVDFDYESGNLFFTTNRQISSASYCTILLDSTFILNGLKQRLQTIMSNGVNDALPFTKFFFGETEELVSIKHKKVPERIKKNLDNSQRKAFEAAIDKDITFIWGPPGTGKSYTLASIIYAFFELGEDRTAVCCLSNVAVDQLLCKVLDIIDKEQRNIAPGNIYRAGRTLDSRILDTDYLFPTDDITDNLRNRIKKNSEKLKRYKDQKCDMTEKAIALKAENKELRENLKERTDFLVKSSRVVFSTISNFVLSNNLYESKFDNLIVDEASMLSMPSLIALGSKISKRLILVGDFQQLSPIAIVKDEFLTDSVFEMAGVNIGQTNHPGLHQLLNQRRSNERIVNLFNNIFYNGKLVPTVSGLNDIINSEPYKGKVIVMKKISDGAVRFTKGGTRQNKPFAEGVMELMDDFYKEKHADYSIGVITPYKGQMALIKALIFERNYSEAFNKRVKVGTIYTFQGSECDVIIYDMVDCERLENGKTSRIGKIYAGSGGERLLNVAVSRAKHKLILVCDPTYIRNIPGNTVTDKTRKVFSLLSMYGW